jgi:hypothetical protein
MFLPFTLRAFVPFVSFVVKAAVTTRRYARRFK